MCTIQQDSGEGNLLAFYKFCLPNPMRKVMEMQGKQSDLKPELVKEQAHPATIKKAHE